MVLTAFHGFCMALADSVPGVSGGTIAFILGFYDRFLDALHQLFGTDKDARRAAVRYLLQLGLGWVAGMVASVAALAELFASQVYFMSSLFLGLTLASFPFVIRAERRVLQGQARNCPFALFGLLLVVLLTLLRTNAAGVAIRFAGAPVWMLGYIFVSGAVAITAMVLPGISGSTLLLIAGVYLPAIGAIKAFLGLDLSVMPGLIALGLGVIAGIGLSIHAIRAALRKYRSQMDWLILGLMAGSLYAIVMGPAGLDARSRPSACRALTGSASSSASACSSASKPSAAPKPPARQRQKRAEGKQPNTSSGRRDLDGTFCRGGALLRPWVLISSEQRAEQSPAPTRSPQKGNIYLDFQRTFY